MVNPLGHWPRIPFGTRFWIPLRGLSDFRVTSRLVVTSHPLLVPVHRYFEFSMSLFGAFKYLGLIVLWFHIG